MSFYDINVNSLLRCSAAHHTPSPLERNHRFQPRDLHGNSWSTECNFGWHGQARVQSPRRDRLAVFRASRGSSPPTAKQKLKRVQRLAWPCHPPFGAGRTRLFVGGPQDARSAQCDRGEVAIELIAPYASLIVLIAASRALTTRKCARFAFRREWREPCKG